MVKDKIQDRVEIIDIFKNRT